MSSLRDNPMSSTNSVASTTSSSMEPLPPNKYLMKTLCFSKKSTSMPSKDDYAMLLSCGLGARKWQVSLDLDAETFKYALLNIYPRLSTVSGFTLWTLTKDKTFEKLPQKVNTPGRVRAYLGSQFTGCLIIMPTEEISLGPSPKTSGMDTDVTLKGSKAQASARDRTGRFCGSYDAPASAAASSAPSQSSGGSNTLRHFCLLCGRMAKPTGSPAFYNINTQMLTTDMGHIPLAKRLREILRIELPRKKMVPSEEICKKCFRQLNEIDYLEAQLKNNKDDLINNFFSTVSKISRIDQHILQQNNSAAAAAASNNFSPAAAAASSASAHYHHQLHRSQSYSSQYEDTKRPPPQQPQAAASASQPPAQKPYNGHLHHAEVGVPQRVFLTPSVYQSTFAAAAVAAAVAAQENSEQQQQSHYSSQYRRSHSVSEDDEEEHHRHGSHPPAHHRRYSLSSPSRGVPQPGHAHSHAEAQIAAAEQEKERAPAAAAAAQDLVNYELRRKALFEETERRYQSERKRSIPSPNTLMHNEERLQNAEQRDVSYLYPPSGNNSSSSRNSSSPDDCYSGGSDASVSPSRSSPPQQEAGQRQASAKSEKSPRKPWKKRCREIEEEEEKDEESSCKAARIDKGSQDVRSNNDSGHGGSDEDSTASTTSEVNAGRMNEQEKEAEAVTA